MIEQLTHTAPVREVVASLLRELGMTTVFGNPGSTELRFLKDWPDDFRYVMGLHEGGVVAMADAYAQVTGNAAFVNLHSAGGLGNAMGTLFTAYRNNAPLVVVAGQQTRAMLINEPFLFAADATTLPRPYVKWSYEPARAEDVPVAIARAYLMAMQRPFGPAFVSVPEDDWEREVPAITVRRIASDFVGDDAALASIVDALNDARAPVIVVGAGVDRDRAAGGVVRLAERLRAPVWASALVNRCGFPEDHPLFAGALPRIRRGVVASLRGHDVVLVLGAPVFNYHVHSDGPYVDPGTTVFQLTDDPAAAAGAAVGTSVLTAIGPAVERLLTAVQAARREAPAARTRTRVAPGERISIAYLLQTLAETMPHDAIVVEETPSSHTFLHEYLPLQPGAYFAAASGSLGYGLPAAAGAALAAPGRRILALIGDGSAHYGIQGLWTAVEHRLPITFVIVNNEGYGAMNSFAELMGSQRSPSFAIRHVDFTALAQGYGCTGRRVTRAEQLADALREGLRSDGPALIDVAVDATAPRLF